MVWYGMVNVDLYSAIITKVSNALDTLVSGEKPGFQTLSEGLIIHRFKKRNNRLSNKPFLIWLLTTPPYLKYVATLIVNRLFSDINVSLGCVATYARCHGICNRPNQFTSNLLQNLPV